MNNNFEEAAINASLAGDWMNAIKLNQEILSKDRKDVDALNRLCFAYIQNGNKTLAKRIILQALKIDKFNNIALKNLNLLKNLPKKSKSQGGSAAVDNINFIEEPKAAKIVTLVEICPKSSFVKLRPGTKLEYKLRRRRICVFCGSSYIGKFTDDLNKTIREALKKKLSVEIFFKSFDDKKATVFLYLKNN